MACFSSVVVGWLDPLATLRKRRLIHWGGSFSDRCLVLGLCWFIKCCTSLLRPCSWILKIDDWISLLHLKTISFILQSFLWTFLVPLHLFQSGDLLTSCKCTFTIVYCSTEHISVPGHYNTWWCFHRDEMILSGNRFALYHEVDLPLSFFVLWRQLSLIWSHLYVHLVCVQLAVFWLISSNRRCFMIYHIAVRDPFFCQESKRWLYILCLLFDIFQFLSI